MPNNAKDPRRGKINKKRYYRNGDRELQAQISKPHERRREKERQRGGEEIEKDQQTQNPSPSDTL